MTDRALAGPAARSRGGAERTAPVIALALLLGILVAAAVVLLRAGLTIVAYRYSIDYGEGIVWQQMLNMVAGTGYAPIGVFPAIVYHYPPVYHLTVAALTALTGDDALAVGRTLSLVATLCSALIVGLVTHKALAGMTARESRRLAAMLAGLLFLVCRPVGEWAPTFRVDMLACVLSLGGMLLAFAALRRPRLIHLAAILFVLGVFTKQMALAAPAATILGLALARPRLALTCLVTATILGLAILAALEIGTHGGFLRHVILYNINRNDAARLAMLAAPLRDHAAFLALAGFGVLAAWRHRTASAPTDEARAILPVLGLYLVFKTVMLAMIVKSGGSTNYMIEWFAPVGIFAGIGAAFPITLALGEDSFGRTPSRSPVMATMLLAAAALQAIPLGQWGDFSQEAANLQQRLDRLVVAIRNSPQPVISDDMTLIVRAGRPVMWEPSIAAELASVGRYDEPRFVAMIRAHCFSGFVTVGERGQRVFDSRYNPPVADAMDAAYPLRRDYAGLQLHLPAPGVPVRSCGTMG